MLSFTAWLFVFGIRFCLFASCYLLWVRVFSLVGNCFFWCFDCYAGCLVWVGLFVCFISSLYLCFVCYVLFWVCDCVCFCVGLAMLIVCWF